MAKKSRKGAAVKAAKKSKGSKKKKAAPAKKGRKVLARKKNKPVAKKKPVRKVVPKPPPESFAHKIEDVVKEIADIFTDAERLDQKLNPGVSREPE
jgi:hypothetical protein